MTHAETLHFTVCENRCSYSTNLNVELDIPKTG